MKIPSLPRAALRGNILLVTLVVTGLAGLALITYLGLVSQQTKVTARSQTYQSCLTVAEAGIEDALAHLNKNGLGNPDMAAGEWKKVNGIYTVTRDLGDGYYKVSIQTGARPIITSTGYLPAPLAFASASTGAATGNGGGKGGGNGGAKADTIYLSRTIKVQCRAVGRFTKAIVARSEVQLNGKNVKVDSFDSYNTNLSTMGTNGYGTYNSNKFSANGDVAVIDGFKDTLEIKDAQIWGKVATGPDGNLKTNKSISVGDAAWHAAGTKGVQDGWATDDASFSMPSVTAPFTTGIPPIGGFIGTNYYDYILTSGDWAKNGNLQGKVYVAGNARFYVKNDIKFRDGATDDDGIEFAPGATLALYCAGREATFTGGKNKKKTTNKLAFNDDGNATNFMFFGTDNLTKVNLSKCDEFTGIVYAPNAEIVLKAGSAKYYHCNVTGALLGFRVKLEKNASLHYDENIANLEAESYVIESWTEVANSAAL